jgi:hypothetical protein
MAAGGSVSGNVKGPSNLILSGVEVDIMAQDGFSYGYPASGDFGTDANGNFTVDGLPAGSYTVSFSSWALGSYTDQWWQNQPSFGSANFFTVSAGQTVTGKNTTLGRLATISGNVKGAGAPNANLAGVNVVAIPVDTGPVLGVGDGPTYYAQTDAAGNFTITGLDPDSYTLEFIPGWPDFGGLNYVYAGEYWGGKSSEGTASYFPVSSGQTVTGRDIVLPASSSVSGTVTSSGVPLQGIISVYDTSGSADSQSTLVTDVHTNVDGTYTVPGLGAGSYRVGFSTQTGGYEFEPGFAANEALVAGASGYALASSDPYVSQWYSAKYSYSSAGSVVVPSAGAAVTGINFTIENPTFADVSDPSYSFYPYIQWMSSTGFSTGTGQPTGKPLYKPSAAVSRQAMASFMYKLSGTTFVPPGTPTFADVDSSSPFYTAVEWMASTGISTGTGQPSGKPLFKPTDAVSRSAMALFLARYDHVDTSTAPTSQSFADVPVTASSAAAIAWMASSGISTGTAQPSGLPVYLPANPVSRSAMAAFLYRLAHLPA